MSGSRASRVSRRRLDTTTLVAAVLVVLVAAILGLVHPDAAAPVSRPPDQAPLTRSSVICPSAPSGDTTLALTSAGQDASGSFTLTTAGGDTDVEVSSDRVTRRDAPDGPVVVTGSGDLAPGVVAGLLAEGPRSVLDCAPPTAEHWFTGVGAGPTHGSVLELVNPNAGPAVVDVEMLSEDGPVEVGALRGIAVDGHRSERIDLGRVVPRSGVLALHATVVRGQLGVAVRDRGEQVTGAVTTEDWLPAQSAPARHALLLGLTPGGGRHTLTIANDGDAEVRATIRLISPDSVFQPAGLEPVTVPPHSVAQTELDDVLGADVGADAIGAVVDATGPVTSGLRSISGSDLVVLAPGETVHEPTTVLVPTGDKRLLLGGADAVGVVIVTARDADGDELLERRVSVSPGQGAKLDLPEAAMAVTVTPQRTSVQGVVLVDDTGLGAVRLREQIRTGAVPGVGPGLP